MDVQHEVQRLKSLLRDAEAHKSEIIRIYYNLVKEKSADALDAVPYLNQSAALLLPSDVTTILKKHRLDAFSYILVANNLIDLEDLTDDLLNGTILVDTVPANAIRRLKQELGLATPQRQLDSAGSAHMEKPYLHRDENRLAIKIAKECPNMKSLGKNGMMLYKLPLQETSTYAGASSIIRRFSFGDPNIITENNLSKTILLMGATGSGKTTMINAMINYILGVEWDDPFRFVLVDEEVRMNQAFSQTREITAYDIHYREGFRIPYSLIIIDTPGFGDTEGIKRDKEITAAVKQFFEHENGIQELNAVGFVVQSALARLTQSQTYIFNSVLSIFGKDIKENVRFLVTFADGRQPLVLEAIKQAELPCLIDSNGLPSHQSFNNGSIFVSNQIPNDRMSKIEWEYGIDNFKIFFSELSKMSVKSLQLTKDVLKNRETLRNTISVLKTAIDLHLTKMEGLKDITNQVIMHKNEIAANRDFEIEVTVAKKTKVPAEEQTAMNCKKCEMTCHYPCNPILPIGWCPAFWNPTGMGMLDVVFGGMVAMASDLPCKVCPGKCGSNHHKNEESYWTHVEVKERQTHYEIRKKYEEAKQKKLTAKELMFELQEEIDRVKKDIIAAMKEITRCSNELKQTALRGDPLTTPEYIELMIINEENERKAGYRDRIVNLRELLKDAKLAEDIAHGKGKLFKQYSENHH